MKNLQNLTLVILTYNRPRQIAKLIYEIISCSKKYKFNIIILDDSKNSTSEKYFKKIKKISTINFTYLKNKKNLGHDQNYIKGLKLSKTFYTWMIGDSTRIDINYFDKLHKILNYKNDLIVLGAKNREYFLKKKIKLNNKSLILENLAWYLSLLGSCILSKKVTKDFKEINFSKFKNFPHLGLIFSKIYLRDIKIKIFKKPVISSFNKKSYWLKDIFNVFLIDLSNSINNLPYYKNESKITAVRNHSNYSKIFNFISLLMLKSENYYNFKTFLRYKKYLKQFTNYNLISYLSVLLLPTKLLKKSIDIYRSYKK